MSSGQHYTPYLYRPPAPLPPSLEPVQDFSNKQNVTFSTISRSKASEAATVDLWRSSFQPLLAEKLLLYFGANVLDAKLGVAGVHGFLSSFSVGLLFGQPHDPDRHKVVIRLAHISSWSNAVKVISPGPQGSSVNVRRQRTSDVEPPDAIMFYSSDSRIHILFDLSVIQPRLAQEFDTAWRSQRSEVQYVAAIPKSMRVRDSPRSYGESFAESAGYFSEDMPVMLAPGWAVADMVEKHLLGIDRVHQCPISAAELEETRRNDPALSAATLSLACLSAKSPASVLPIDAFAQIFSLAVSPSTVVVSPAIVTIVDWTFLLDTAMSLTIWHRSRSVALQVTRNSVGYITSRLQAFAPTSVFCNKSSWTDVPLPRNPCPMRIRAVPGEFTPPTTTQNLQVFAVGEGSTIGTFAFVTKKTVEIIIPDSRTLITIDQRSSDVQATLFESRLPALLSAFSRCSEPSAVQDLLKRLLKDSSSIQMPELALKPLCACMANHRTNPAIQKLGLDVLINATVKPFVRARAALSGAISQALAAISAHHNVAEVLLSGCSLLAALSTEKIGREAIAKEGGVQVLLKNLSFAEDTRPGLACSCLKALRSIIDDSAVPREAVPDRKEMTPAVIGLLGKRFKDPSVQLEVLEFLVRLPTSPAWSQLRETVMRPEVALLIAQGMKVAKTIGRALECGLELLHRFADDEALLKAIRDSSVVIDSVIGTVAHHPSNFATAKSGIELLGRLACTGNCQRIRDEGGMDAVFIAMREQSTSAAICRAGCQVLAELVVEGRDDKDVVEVVIDATAAHMNHPEVLEGSCHAVTSLTLASQENAFLICGYGGPQLILEGLSAHKRHSGFVSSACTALATLLAIEECCQEIIDLRAYVVWSPKPDRVAREDETKDALELLRDALEAHPQNREIQEKANMAISLILFASEATDDR